MGSLTSEYRVWEKPKIEGLSHLSGSDRKETAAELVVFSFVLVLSGLCVYCHYHNIYEICDALCCFKLGCYYLSMTVLFG